MEREEFFRMKKIQAKKKRDKGLAATKEEEFNERQPDDGRPTRNLLDEEDDLPVLFT